MTAFFVGLVATFLFRSGIDWIVIALLAGMSITSFWYSYAWQRSRRFIAGAGLRLCPRCLYDLRDLDQVGRCPECGRPYTLALVEEAWERKYWL